MYGLIYFSKRKRNETHKKKEESYLFRMPRNLTIILLCNNSTISVSVIKNLFVFLQNPILKHFENENF